MPCLAIQSKHSRVHCIPEKTKLHPTERVVFPLFRTRTGHWMLTGLCASIFIAVLCSFNAEMSFFGLKNQSCSIQAAAHLCLVSELEKQRKSRQRCWVQNKLCKHMHCVILLTKKTVSLGSYKPSAVWIQRSLALAPPLHFVCTQPVSTVAVCHQTDHRWQRTGEAR